MSAVSRHQLYKENTEPSLCRSEMDSNGLIAVRISVGFLEGSSQPPRWWRVAQAPRTLSFSGVVVLPTPLLPLIPNTRDISWYLPPLLGHASHISILHPDLGTSINKSPEHPSNTLLINHVFALLSSPQTFKVHFRHNTGACQAADDEMNWRCVYASPASRAGAAAAAAAAVEQQEREGESAREERCRISPTWPPLWRAATHTTKPLFTYSLHLDSRI